jgi:hypothetical protein
MKLQNPENIVLDTKRLVESNKRSEIRLNANGGNSILIVCDPKMEHEYINAINKILDSDTYQIIDLNNLLTEFVELNKSDLTELFELLKVSVHQIFKAPQGEESNDLFGLIIKKIADSFTNNKIPILINSGTLYGSGIDNIHIMESEIVMKSSLPLIVLYPATHDIDNLLFLNKRPASKYRCLIINDFKS